MNAEINTLIEKIENINSGEPWFGRSVYELLDEVDAGKAHTRVQVMAHTPGHTLATLLWHMVTWASFTLQRIEKNKDQDPASTEEPDWRTIDPKIHTWKKGLTTFKSIHKKIIQHLKEKNDPFLDEIVEHRQYDFRFLINGMIEHNIYHAGQIAYIHKLLS